MLFSFAAFALRLRAILLTAIAGTIILLVTSWNNSDPYRNLINSAGEHAYNTSTTFHTIPSAIGQLHYRTTSGYLNVSTKSTAAASIFYTAYSLDSQQNRPLTFVFNGGPGSASIWLHMAALGPNAILPGKDNYGSNPYTWLNFTDLVFIDPPGTGYSRAADGVNEKQFYGYHQDVRATANFIKCYLQVNHRTDAAICLAGESYGAARAVGLTAYLKDSLQIRVRGLTLISPALNYQLLTFKKGNDLPYPYYLPTYALTAWYHHRLNNRLQALTANQLIGRTTRFAETTFRSFLQGGGELTEAMADTLSELTGLSKAVVKQYNGRIPDQVFSHLLLDPEDKRTGIYDGRATGSNVAIDPAELALRASCIPAFQNYITKELHYSNRLPYKPSIATPDWDFGGGYLNVIGELKALLHRDQGLYVQVMSGTYDLATPAAATENCLSQLGLDIHDKRLTWQKYSAGHMFYTDVAALAKFSKDSYLFYQNLGSSNLQ